VNRRANIFILGTLILALVTSAGAETFNRGFQDNQPIRSKSPDDYFPANFSKHAGKLLLNTNGPSGMFVGYPADGQDMPTFIDEMKATVRRVFFHDVSENVWYSQSLSGHTGVEEKANLFMAFDATREVQLAFYERPEGFAYGYFAMRHTNGDKRWPEGQFIDSLGAGVKAFDAFVDSISAKPKQ
jgi:hypothetical protein